MSRGPAEASFCQICCLPLKSTVFSLKTFADSLKWVSVKIPIVPGKSNRICHSCKTIIHKVTAAEELAKEIRRAHTRKLTALGRSGLLQLRHQRELICRTSDAKSKRLTHQQEIHFCLFDFFIALYAVDLFFLALSPSLRIRHAQN